MTAQSYRLEQKAASAHGGRARKTAPRLAAGGLIAASWLVLCLASCTSPRHPEITGSRPIEEEAIADGAPRSASGIVPAGYVARAAAGHPAAAPPRGRLELVPLPLPAVPGAEHVGNDDFCGTCHQTYKEAFSRGVHGRVGCEKCHGAASLHVQSRGLSPGTILSMKPKNLVSDTGLPLSAAERSEICMQCHGDCTDLPKSLCLSASRWRESAHANRGIACSDCHTVHYLVPPGTPAVDRVTAAQPPHRPEQAPVPLAGAEITGERPLPAERNGTAPPGIRRLPPVEGGAAAAPCVGDPQPGRLVDYRTGPAAAEKGSVPLPAGAARPLSLVPLPAGDPRPQPGSSKHLGAVSPGLCYRCHADKQRLEQVDHPHRMGVPFAFQCTACHATVPRGYPHEVPGHPKQFDCTTCHDPHGSVLPETRKDLCLKCHSGGRMHEWKDSPHDRSGVACTDCHNPHPKEGLPMAVVEPAACFRCHTEKRELATIAHPHQVGGASGMNCTTCHTPHGPLREESRTDLCLKCHNGTKTGQWHSSAHSQEGVACTDCHNPHPRSTSPRLVEISSTQVTRPVRLPMAVEEPNVCYKCHPKIANRVHLPSRHPIQEGKLVCSDCHDVHRRRGEAIDASTINLLCYKCHAEKQGPFAYEHPPVTENCCYCHEPHGTVEKDLLRQSTSFLCLRCHTGHRRDPNRVPHWSSIDGNPAAQQALYSDCAQCHFEIHGTDYPSATRIGPIMTDH